MATLEGQTIAASYKDLLQVSNSNSGVDATARAVSDGEGTATLLYLSTTEVYNPGTGGTSNTAFGKNAGDALTTNGNYNVVLGEEAGSALTIGDNNVSIGYGSFDAAADDESDNIAIGSNAMGAVDQGSHGSADADQNVCIGTNAGLGGDFGSSNIDMADNIAIGYGAMDGTGTLGALKNVFIGSNAGGGSWTTAQAQFNVGIGHNVMDAAMNDATCNVAVGFQALSAVTTSDNNVAIGYDSLGALTSGDQNVAVGYQALDGITDAQYNTAIGYAALTAGNHADTDHNTAVGHNAGVAITQGHSNIVVGSGAAATLTTGDQNTYIGKSCDASASSATNETVLGYGATAPAGGNSVTLGNADVTEVYCASDKGANLYAASCVVTTGINFPDDASANPSGDVNTLDNYEEGSWTPTLLGASGNPTQTYAGGGQVGAYTKIGRFVFCHGRIVMGSGITVGSGAARIGALPFTAKSLAGTYGTVNISYGNNWGTNVGIPNTGYVEPNTVYCDLQVHENDGGKIGGTSGANAADVDDGTDLIFGIVYAT